MKGSTFAISVYLHILTVYSKISRYVSHGSGAGVPLAQEEEEDESDMWKKWKMPVPLKEPPARTGTGTLYEVIYDTVIGRPAPSFAAPKQTLKTRGDVIELFEFDATRDGFRRSPMRHCIAVLRFRAQVSTIYD